MNWPTTILAIGFIITAFLSKKREDWWQKTLWQAKIQARIDAYKDIEKTTQWLDTEKYLASRPGFRLNNSKEDILLYELRCMLKKKIVTGL